MTAAASEPPSPHLIAAGRTQADGLTELSGLAASRRVAGRWWGLNDSGNPPELFAFDGSGRDQGRVAIGVPNVDWEDLASYERDGRSYLAIADTGDNFSFRPEVAVHVVEEPGVALPTAPLPVRTIRFRFEDGPRDCESLAADPAHARFLLLDKQRHPAGLYELPMDGPADTVAVARRLADLPSLWAGEPGLTTPIGTERYRGTPTAADLSADGRRLVVLTYTHLAIFDRAAGEDWPQALRRAPVLLRLPRLRIAEALGLSADGRGALIGGERRHGPLLEWDGSAGP